MTRHRSLWESLLDALGSTERAASADEAKSDRGFAKALVRKGRQVLARRSEKLAEKSAQNLVPKTQCPPLHMDVDAAFQECHGKTPRASVGIHIREWGLGVALPIRAAISSEAEAVGIWVTLHLAARLKVQPIIACDNQSVAESIAQHKLTLGRWRAEAPTRTPLFASRIIHEARKLRTQIKGRVEWTEREDNHVPHLLAALAVRKGPTLAFLPSDEAKAEERLLKHDFRSESLAKIQGLLPIELSQEGLAWQDWNTQRYLDALAERIRTLAAKRASC